MRGRFIYLDHAATTPIDPLVLKAMEPYLRDKFYNPAAPYGPARAVAKDLQAARARVAYWLGARSSEIIFAAGGTEANNLAIHGVMQQYPQANAVVSAIEHEAALEPAKTYDVRYAAVLPDGIVDIAKLKEIIDERTVLISIMYANNEIGTIQPLRRIAEMLVAIRKQRRAAGNTLPLYFHTDAAQAAGYLDMHVNRLGVDLMSLNGSKIYGPKQTGVLYVSSKVHLKPQILGGGQERGFRAGTENVAGCIGLATALDLVQTNRQTETARLRSLQQYFMEQLRQVIPSAVVNGSLKHRLPNNIHVTLPGQDNERLIIKLEADGILCAAGSACRAASTDASHVLKALGLDEALARASLRFTMGRETTEATLLRTVQALKAALV